MKNLRNGKAFEKIIAIILVIATMMSYFPMSIFAESENNGYITFKANWAEGGSSLTTLSDTMQNIKLGVTLSKGPVFNNLTIYAEDITEDTTLPSAYIKFGSMDKTTVAGGGRTLVFDKSMNSGYSAQGNLSVSFPRTEDFSEYDKTIKLTIVGEQKLNSVVTQINEERILTVHVMPKPIVEQFSSNVDSKLTHGNITGQDGSYARYNSALDWAVSWLKVKATIPVKSANETYSKIKLNIDRTTPQNIEKNVINNETNLQIQVMSSAGYHYDIVRETDGTTYIEFTRGEQLNNFDENTKKYGYANIEVHFIYKVVEDTSTGTGTTLIKTNTQAYVEGVSTVKDINGTEYTKGNYSFNVERETSLNIWSNARGNRRGNDYDTWIKGNDIDEASFVADADDNNITATFTTEAQGYIDVNEEPDESRLFIYNYNRPSFSSGAYSSDLRAEVKYRVGDFDEGSVYIDNDEMTLKKISMQYFDSRKTKRIDFYKPGDDVDTATPFFTATSSTDEYIVPEGEEITEYFAVVTGYTGDYYNNYITLGIWNTDWNLDLTKLPSGVDASKIRKVSRRQFSPYKQCTSKLDGTDIDVGSQFLADCQAQATINIDFNQDHYASYAEFELDNYNGKASSFGTWEANKKINISFKPSSNISERKVTKNENPILYVQLPEQYDYRNFKVQLTGVQRGSETNTLNTNGYIYLKEFHQETIQGLNYLVIELDGTYQEDLISGNVGITITHQRRLKTQDVPSMLPVYVYMLTDNERYSYNIVSNSSGFANSQSSIPSSVMLLKQYFGISENNHISTITTIYDKTNTGRQPGEDENGIKLSSKRKPLVFEENDIVKYISSIEVANDRIHNLDIIVRLPKENNKPITTNDYTFDSTMSLNLVSCDDIQVEYRNMHNESVILEDTDYELMYSTSEESGYDSTYHELNNSVDLSTVKTLRIKLDEEFELNDKEKIYITYKMQVPESNQDKISGATTAIRFQKNDETEVLDLESVPAYVKSGDPKGDVTIQKKFEGVADGDLPLGVDSLAGIQFKLINIDTNQPLILDGQTTSEGIVSTNAQGKIELTGVPEGLYRLEEITEFEYYNGIDYTDVMVEQGTVTPNPVEALNKLKRGDLVINKTWEGTNVAPYNENDRITFKITGQDTLAFIAEKDLDHETGSVTFHGVPYGTYTIEESSGLYGWYLANEEVEQEVKAPTVTFTAENKIARGTLVIVKTMPAEDDVRNITLRVTGTGITYKDEHDNDVTLDVDLSINVGDYSANTDENIRVDLNDATKPTKATITISNLPLATYKIEETNIPTFPIAGTEMYKPIVERATINSNGETVRKTLRNSWKTGSLKIIKKAENGVPLNQFKVLVKLEESEYITPNYTPTYEREFDIPASGELTIDDLYVGKYSVTELDTPYYNTKYAHSDDEEKSNEPILTEVLADHTSETIVYNESTYGYVKVLKYLEDKDAENTVGIKFRLSGKYASGADVTEIDTNGVPVLDDQGNNILGITREITAENIVEDSVTHKKFGVVVFGPIKTGGEYAIEELNTPQYYRENEPVAVDITKDNIVTNPKVVVIENKRQRGNLEITTKTVPEGGELTPIKYRVTEITLNPDAENSEDKIIKGDVIANLDAVAGFANLTNIYAGTYLVEQTQVPANYITDYPQIVEVPDKATGYAEFEISKPELKNTYLTVEKEIVTKAGNVPTQEEFAAAGLSADELFEVRITNVDTQTTYFTFMSTDTPGKIKGIPAGRYEIEEVYKPKYLASEYFLKDGDEYSAIEGINEKYYFEIAEPTAGEDSQVTIKLRNVINTDFGFAGQNSANNFSKTAATEAEQISKTILFFVDEDGNAATGAKFKFYDENDNEIPLAFNDNTYEVGTDKRLIINGLPEGKYKVKAVSLPEGYLPVEDKVFYSFDKATYITRIELLKNKPRGTLRLSTTYTTYEDVERQTENGTVVERVAKTINTPRSKYKILDSATGTVLKFEKTADGNYIRSKLDSATDTISLRAGSVLVKGIEIGDYEVGIVDLTEKYGIINVEPERVTVLQDTVVPVEVPVKKRNAFKKFEPTYTRDFALTDEGELYVFGVPVGCQDFEGRKFSDIAPALKDVKVKDFSVQLDSSSRGTIVMIDEDGKIWTDCFGYEGSGIGIYNCLNDMEDHPFNGLKFTKVSVIDQENGVYALDEYGRIWFWGQQRGSYLSNLLGLEYMQPQFVPVCLSDFEDFQGIKFVDIDASNYNFTMAIDSVGKVYEWGYFGNYNTAIETGSTPDNYGFVCVSDIEGNNLADVRIKSLSVGRYHTTSFIDYEGNIWICGNYGRTYGQTITPGYGNALGTDAYGPTVRNPICLTKIAENPLNGKKFTAVSSTYTGTMALDTNGKLWAWGSTQNSLGFGGYYYEDKYLDEPVCISDVQKSNIKNVRLNYLSRMYDSNSYGINEDGEAWLLTCESGSSDNTNSPLGRKLRTQIGQQKIDFPQNAYFDLFEVQDMSISSKSSLIRDKSGRLWTPGHINEFLINKGLYELVDYQGSELGAPIKGAVKAYEVGGDSALIIDENDKLWTVGMINHAYLKVTNSNGPEIMDPLCITDLEKIDGITPNPLYNKKVKCIAVNKGYNTSYGQVAVIDEDGKLYTGGYYSAYNLGYPATSPSDHNSMVPLTCWQDTYTSAVWGKENIRFKKVVIYDLNVMMAIDEDGDLYTWGDKDYCCVENPITSHWNSYVIYPAKVQIPGNAKIVDVAVSSRGGIALDENGKLYNWGQMFGNNGTSSTTPVLTEDSAATILNDKKFVKIGIWNNYGIVVDSDGNIYGLMGIRGVSNFSSSFQTEYGDVKAKDIFLGPNTIVVKDIFDDIYVFGNYSLIGGKDGTSVGSSSYRMSDSKPNPLYGKTVSHQISDNVISVEENDKETVYILDATGNVKGSRVLDTVKAYINKVPTSTTVGGYNVNGKAAKTYSTKGYTVIFDGQNHLYNVSGYSLNLQYPDAIMDKIVYQDDALMLVQDTEGNTYKVTWNSVIKYEGVQLSKILYKDYNIMIMNDTNGNMYKITADEFRILSGFDSGVEIESIWAERLQSGTTTAGVYTVTNVADLIYFQDSNNGLWVTIQDVVGGESTLNKYGSYAGLPEKETNTLNTVQKIERYTGGKIKELYRSDEIACIDEDNKLWIWGNDRNYEWMQDYPTVVFENVVDYETSENGGHLVLDEEGNLYTYGSKDFYVDKTMYHNYMSINGRLGIPYDDRNYFSLTNLSTDTSIGKVKLFYLGDQGAIVVNENNQIYACMYGSEPMLYNDISYTNIDHFTTYSPNDWTTYSSFEAESVGGVNLIFGMSVFRRVISRSMDGSDPRDIRFSGAIPTDGGDVTIAEPNSSAITSEISTNSLDPNRTTGLIVKEDKKLYLDTNDGNTSTCISDRAGTVDVFGKQFKVIRDSNYIY